MTGQTIGQTMKTTKPFILIALGAALLLPRFSQAESLGFSLSGDSSSGEIAVSVQDDLTLEAIPDALVSVGDTFGIGLNARDEWVTLTGSLGESRFKDLTGGAKTITVYKEGYSAITLVGAQSSRVQIFLKPLATRTPEVIASGIVGGWPVGAPRDVGALGKPVHVGLAFRTLSAFDLLHFNIGTVVSPLKDVIDVWGERHIPSNVVMPRQRIPVFLGSVEVNKPNYRLPVPSGRESRMLTVQGVIDSGDLIDIGQSGTITPDAVNKFQFNRLGLSEVFNPSADFQLNLTGDRALAPAFNVTVNRPPFPADVLAVAYADLGGDRRSLVPTDVKTPVTQAGFGAHGIRASAVSLRSTSAALGQSRGVVAVAVTRDAKRLSGIITEAASGNVSTGDYLPAENLPDVAALPASIRIQAPKLGLGVTVIESGVQIGNKIRTFPVWTVVALPAAGEVQVPTARMPVQQQAKTYSVNQLEFGADFNERAIDGQSIMTSLKRFSRAAAWVGPRAPRSNAQQNAQQNGHSDESWAESAWH